MYCRCAMYIIENDYRNYRIFTFTIFETIFAWASSNTLYKSFEITVIQIGIPEDLIERTLWKVPVKVPPLLPAVSRYSIEHQRTDRLNHLQYL